jgi:hypothetical protein
MKGFVFSQDTRDLIRLLAVHKVCYLIVGGMAVIYHGHARLTGDVDFFYESTKANAGRLFRALREFWKGPIPLVANLNDLLTKNSIIQFGIRPNRVDLMNSITGVTFKEAWAGRIEETIKTPRGIFPLPIIGLAALEKNKKSLGRYKDLDDLLFIRPARKKVEERQSVIARSSSKRRLP